MMFSSHLQAGPTDGEVIFGEAEILHSNPQQTDIVQNSDKVIIDWRSFSIDKDEIVHFQQPSLNSIALNRIKGDAASSILGRLLANGQIMLINPNGILFGSSAIVDVGGLVATTIDIDNEDFIAGRYNFNINRNPGSTVVNRGTITATEGGIVALVAPGVGNSGVISARLGQVTLASGNLFTLDLCGDKLIQLGIDDRVTESLITADGTELKALVDHSGSILADGGIVILMAVGAAKNVVDYAVNMEGIVQARSAQERNGQIVLEGTDEGVVRVTGTLDASGRSAGETGGSVKVLGSKVGIVGQARLDVSGDAGGGEVLVGGNFQGKGPERNAKFTVVGSGVEISADALTAGDGGRVIVWSDQVTRFFGKVSARGGSISGDGGFAEISGKQSLQFTPIAIDLSAPNGSIGDLLLDPQDITISDDDGTDNSKISATDTSINFGDDSTSDYKITPAAFETINADVTLQASRDITVSSAIDRSGSAASTLTLQAGRHLTINASITGTNGAHSFIFEADSPRSTNNNGTGTLTIGSGVTITSNNGDITLIGADFQISTTATTSINAGSGAIHVAPSRATAAMTLGNSGILSRLEIARFSTSGTINFGTATTGPTSTGGAGSSISASSITVSSNIGISGSASIVFDSSGTTTLSGRIINGGDITFKDAVNLNANVFSNDGDITFEDAVTLGANVTVDSDQNDDGTDGNITFNSTINGSGGSRTLTLDADGGAVTVSGAMGGGSGSNAKLASLTVTGGAVSLRGVETTGVIAVSGSSGITLNGSYLSADGNITFTGAVTLVGTVRVDSDQNDDGTDGNITFTSTINGSGGIRTITLDADGGSVTVSGAIGNITRLGRLTVNGGQIDLNSIVAFGHIVIEGTNIDLNGTTYRSDNGSITFTGPVDLLANADVTLHSSLDFTVSSAINRSGSSASTVTLQAGRHLTISASITGTGGAHSFIFEADSPKSTNNNGSGTLTIGSNVTITTNNGSVTLIGAGFNIDSTSSINAGTGDIHVAPSRATAMTIGGAARNLSNSEIGRFTTSGTINIGTATTGPARDGTAGSSISATSITISEALAIGGGASIAFDSSGTTTLSANVSANDGDITFKDAVVLGANVTVDSDANNTGGVGNITFNSTINGRRALTLNAHRDTSNTGSVTVSGAVGGSTKLASLSVDGGQIDIDTVATTGNIDFDGTNIDLNGATYRSDSGSIILRGPVDLLANADVTLHAARDLTVSSAISRSGSSASTVTFQAGRHLTINASITGSNGAHSFIFEADSPRSSNSNGTGTLRIGSNVTITSNNGDITLIGAGFDIHSTSSTNAGTGDIHVAPSRAVAMTIGGATGNLSNSEIGRFTTSGTINIGTATTGPTSTGGAGSSTSATFITISEALTITGSASIVINSGSTITLSANVSTQNGNITFQDAVNLGANVTVDSDADNTGGIGNITFSSTINGRRALTMDAHRDASNTGSVTVFGAVGGSTRLTSLTVDGGQIDVNAVATTGNIDIEGTNIDLNGATYRSDNGNIAFIGSVDLHANVTVNSDANNSGGVGNITFSSTINGRRVLTLDAHRDASNTGSVTVSGAMGGTTALTSLTVTGGTVSLRGVKTTGVIRVTGTSSITLNGSYLSDDGNITFTGAVTLAGSVTVNSDEDNDDTDGNISFSSTINGGHGLTLDAGSGSVTLPAAVGSSTKLSSLTVDGGQIDVSTVATTGNIDIEGTNIDLNGATYRSDDGSIIFRGPVDLHANVSVNSDQDTDATDGNITFTSTINGSGGSRTLTLNADGGSVTVSGAMGGGSGGNAKLASLTVTGGAVSLRNVKTAGVIGVTGTSSITLNGSYLSDNGNITFTGAVILAGSVTVNSDENNDGTDGNISFSSTVNSGHGLTLDADGGSVTVSGAMGGTTALTSLTVDGGQIDVSAVATTGTIDIEGTNIDLNGATYFSDDGSIFFRGPVDLHANVTVTSDQDEDGTDGNIMFTSTINGSGGSRTLTLDADGGSVTVSGAMGGGSGSNAKLASLTVSGGAVLLRGVKTAGAIGVTGTTRITLNGSYLSDDGNITFTGAVTLAGSVTVNSDEDNNGTDGNISFSSTTNGGHALTLDADSGSVTLPAAVGGSIKLASLTVDAGQIDVSTVATIGNIDIEGTNIDLNGATYRSDDGSIFFRGPVDLHANVSVSSDQDTDGTDGNITFTSTVNSSGGSRTLTLDADGGAVELRGAVGGSTKLASLTVDGGQIDVSTVATTGNIDVDGTNIDLNGATYLSDDGSIFFRGPVDLHANVSVNSDQDTDGTDGNITFTSTINGSGGSRTLTLNADGGSVTVSGAMGSGSGSNAKLASLTVTGGAVSLRGVRTAGAIGVTGSSGITLNGSYLSDDGNITFTGAVTLAGSVTVNSDQDNDDTDGSISFSSTINGGHGLTLDAGSGSVTLPAAVGGSTKLARLIVDGGQIDVSTVATTGNIDIEGTNIDLNGATYLSDDGSIFFRGPVDLHANVSMNSDQDTDGTDGNITFTSTINGSGGSRTLTLDADGGSVTVSGAMGGGSGSNAKLASLTVTGGAVSLRGVKTTGAIGVTGGTGITLNGSFLSDDGNITFTGAVTLAGSVSVNSDQDDDGTDGNISFSSTINGGHALTLDADSGSVTVSGAMGGTTALTSLTVTARTVSLRGARTAGAIGVTGSSGITLNGSYLSNDGSITFTGVVTLAGSVSVNSDQDNDSTDGDINFSSTINGGHGLTLDAGSGSVTLPAAVGGSTKLASLTVDGGQIDLNTVATTGNIDIEGTNIDLNGATYLSDDGSIFFRGPVDLHANVSVNSDQDNDGTDGNITFTSTINGSGGSRTLTLDADGGSVTVSGAMGSGSGSNAKLASLTVTGGAVSLRSVKTAGVIGVTGDTRITLNGSYLSDDGNITFTGAVNLAGSTSVNSDEDNDGTDGSISFSSTINGGHALTLDADSGSVTLPAAVGGSIKLASLTVDAGQIDVSTVATTGNIDIEGTNIDLNGATYRSDDGSIFFRGPVDLHANVSVSSDQDTDGTDGNITFTSTVNSSGGSRTLTLDADGGAVELRGAVGGSTKLASLTVDGGQIDVSTVATTGNIDVDGTNIDLNGATYLSDDGSIFFRGPVDLHANVSVNSDQDTDGTDGNITFTSTINGSGGSRTLTLNADGGSVTVSGAMGSGSGSNAKLASLTVTGGSVSLRGVKTAGSIGVTGSSGITLNGSYLSDDSNITFTGAVNLAGSTSVNSDEDNDGTDGNISFSSTINGGHALTLDADTGSVTLPAAVGGSTKLARLTVDGGQIDVSTVATFGNIDIEGTNIDLNGATYLSDDGSIFFRGPVDLHANVSVNSDQDNDGTDGSITFTSSINGSGGSRTLLLDADGGSVTVSGAMGSGSGSNAKLASLTVTGGAVSLRSVKTAGVIGVTGDTRITLNGSYLSDDGNITFTGAVNLAGSTSVNSDEDNDGTDGSISFSSTINGGHALTLDADNGSVTVSGAMGGTTALTSLTVTARTVSLRGVRTAGAIGVTGSNSITLNGSYLSNDGSITFTGAVTLAGSVTVNSDQDNDSTDGNISFSSTINGGHGLTLDAGSGSVTLPAAVGGSTKLASLTVDGGQIDLNTVATTGNIDIEGTNIDLNGATYLSDDGSIFFRGPVDLHANVSVNSDQDNDGTDGNITFTSTINGSGGSRTLTLDADGGSVTVSGAMGSGSGSNAKLASLTVTGGAVSLRSVKTAGVIGVTGDTRITLNGSYLSDDGNITFTGAVNLAGSTSVNSDEDNDGTDGSISFSSTINGGHALTLDADSGSVTLPAAVGGSIKLASLTVDAGQIDVSTVATTGNIDIEGTNIDLNGATYRSDDGSIFFRGPVDLHANVTVNSDQDNDGADGSITFTSTINGSGGSRTLTLDADSGAVELRGAVGGSTKLASLTVDGGQIDLNTVATTGNIDVDGTNIDLNGATYFSDNGSIFFRGPVDLLTDVTVDSDANSDGTDGNITFSSTLNGEHNLTLNADTGSIYFNGNVGATAKPVSITITKAHGVRVNATMNVGSFTQLAGTGTSHFGFNSIHADNAVEVMAQNIFGKIVAQDARLTAENLIEVDVDVGSLTIEAENANIVGKVNGLGGQAAADQTIVKNRGPGSYTFNERAILGTGLGTRVYSELTALPLPKIWTLNHYPATPAAWVYDSLVPMLRASVIDSISGPYITNVYRLPFPILVPQSGTEEYYKNYPGVIQNSQ